MLQPDVDQAGTLRNAAPAGPTATDIQQAATTQMEIARATESDIPGIQLAAAESWRAAYREIYSPDFIEAFIGRAYSVESLRRVLQSEQSVFLVAREEGNVVGFSHAGFGPRGGELYRLYLRPAWWGSGVGDQLLEETEVWLRAEGYWGYSLYVHRGNEAGRRFYARHQFRHLPEHDEEETCFLWKDLA